MKILFLIKYWQNLTLGYCHKYSRNLSFDYASIKDISDTRDIIHYTTSLLQG